MKFEHDQERDLKALNYDEGSKRVEELRKAAVEVDRAYVINKHV